MARTIDQQNVLDSSWIKQSFMLSANAIATQDALRRTLSTASYKYTDTTPGGNFAINAPPQFTRYADIKVGGNGQNQAKGQYRPSQSRGMGRYYSEAIDDNNVLVTMRFGVPQYNSLSNFFTNFYNAEASALARTGRGTSAFFKAGFAIGFVVTLPLQAMMFVGKIASFFTGKVTSKYYYLKPVMPLYWNTVTTMLNAIAVNMGVVPRVYESGSAQAFREGGAAAASDYVTGKNVQDLHALLPEIFDQNGGIDAYAISTRAQRLANAYALRSLQVMQGTNSTGTTSAEQLRQAFVSFQTEQIVDPGLTAYNVPVSPGNPLTQSNVGMDAYLSAYMNISTSQAKGLDSATGDSSGDAESTGTPTDPNYPTSVFGDFMSFVDGELRDGGAFITFKVDSPGTSGESFSSSVTESSIQSKINSMSSTARSTSFDLEHGNIGSSAIAQTFQSVIGAVTDVVNGGLASVGLSGIAAAAGAAYVDIPKMWESSSASLPRMDFTMSLRSPYGNKISRLVNLYLPLSMLLAGALPLSTGKQSYTSPFLCEVYCKGRGQTRLGIIDSMTVTRGAGNTGWTQEGEPLGIDISFSVIDLSTIMSVPIASAYGLGSAIVQAGGAAVGVALGAAASVIEAPAGAPVTTDNSANATAGATAAAALLSSTYDDDNTFTDYMAILGSLTYTDQVYTLRKWKLNLTKQMTNMRSWRSASHFASWISGTVPGRLLNSIARGTDRGSGGPGI